MGKREDALMAKIAAALGKSTEEIKEVAKPLNTTEDRMYQGQAIINFFKARIRPRLELKETEYQFNNRYREWQFKICGHCNREFAYAYHYEGVKFCCIECLDAELRKIGMKVTHGRGLTSRWGLVHPAVISAETLENLRAAYPDSAGAFDVPFYLVRPTLHEEFHQTDQVEDPLLSIAE